MDRRKLRVVHIGRSTCRAISGRGDKSTRILPPPHPLPAPLHPVTTPAELVGSDLEFAPPNSQGDPPGKATAAWLPPLEATNLYLGVVRLGRSTCHAMSGQGDYSTRILPPPHPLRALLLPGRPNTYDV